jgi:hypothetical protein
MLERHDQKTRRICVYGHFRELLSTVLGFWGNLQVPWDSVHFWDASPKTCHFCILGMFSWTIANSFGVLGWVTRPMRLSTFLRGVAKKTYRFCVLGPFSWAIADSFGVLDWFIRSMTLNTYLRGMTKSSSFFASCGHFRELLPIVWGSMEIYKQYNSMHILERNDKKLVVLCFRSFCELLPTVLGCRGDLQRPWHAVHF